jgi:hypothetical protein
VNIAKKFTVKPYSMLFRSPLATLPLEMLAKETNRAGLRPAKCTPMPSMGIWVRGTELPYHHVY